MLPAATSAPPPVPAVSPTAPAFSAGAVIGKSFSVWFGSFVPFSIVTLAVYSPVLVFAAITPAEQGPGWQLGSAVLSFLAQLVVIGALTYGVLESLRGGRPPVGALFGTGFRKMGWVFATSFRVGLWMLLGFVLLVVPAFMWYSALFVAVPAVVAEPNLDSSADALARSRALTKGSRWGIFAVVLVAFAVGFASTAIAGVLGALAGALPHPIPVLLATVLTALASSFSACAAAVAYHDLRVAKEGVATADLVKVFE